MSPSTTLPPAVRFFADLWSPVWVVLMQLFKYCRHPNFFFEQVGAVLQGCAPRCLCAAARVVICYPPPPPPPPTCVLPWAGVLGGNLLVCGGSKWAVGGTSSAIAALLCCSFAPPPVPSRQLL